MFSIVPVSESGSIVARATKLYRFQLESGGAHSEESFSRAVLKTFPLDPPMSEPGRVPAALRDSLFGGLAGQKHRKVDVLWLYADHIPRELLRFGISFFEDIAAVLDPIERAKFGDTNGVKLRLYLVCANRQACDELERSLSPGK